MVCLSIDGVEKSFLGGSAEGSIRVLSQVSLSLKSPSVVAVVGPNGIGKTTLLRSLAGVLSPDRGRILIDGQPPSRCHIGYVPQTNPVFSWLKVIDDIALPLKIRGMPRHERHKCVRQLVEQLALPLPLERRVQDLSGGQRQLINLCRALVGPAPPQVLLLDEPFAALDISAREEFFSHLQEVVAEFKPLVILAAHQLDLAVLAADIVVPFTAFPVVVDMKQVIPVNLPRPRELTLRASRSFQETLARVERAVRDSRQQRGEQ